MALVTGTYVRADNTPLPAGVQPRIEAIPSKNAVSINGQAISVYPQTVTPNATTGAFTFDLIPTVDVIDRDFHYLIRGYWLAPAAYGDTGHTRHDLFETRIDVPETGGTLDELIGGIVAPQALTIVSLTPPPVVIPGVWWLQADPNGNPEIGSGDYYEGVA